MSCVLCETDGGALVWRDARCRVVRVDEPGYVGYCRVVWNAHVGEMTDLDEPDRQRLMQVVFTVERVLRGSLAPAKINLASLGNMTPHLHWHVVARFEDDPHFPNAVWSPALRAAAETNRRVAYEQSLVEALSRL